MSNSEIRVKTLLPEGYTGLGRKIDPAAYYNAMREEVVPECLHTPIVALDRAAIEEFVGEIVKTFGRQNAFLVRRFPPAKRDDRYPIWSNPNSSRIHEEYQVWVRTAYTRYRTAYRHLLPETDVSGLVLHHITNRRFATKCGFDYIRLVPVTRATNSSSAFSEGWGVDLERHVTDFFEKQRKRGYRIKYGGLPDLLSIMDVEVGGGIMEAVRLAQDLVELPGRRPSQASFES